MKVALAQIDTTVGDFEHNAARIRDYTSRARAQGADLVVFPELCVCGYSPRDHLESATFIAQAQQVLADLATAAEWSRGVGVLVGFPEPHDGPGHGLYNACALIDDGEIVAVGRKVLLPSYDVFDERRYFDAADAPAVARFRGQRVGLSICEDLWNDDQLWKRRLYPRDPIQELCDAGVDLIVNLAASPYHRGKPRARSDLGRHAARRHGVPLVFVNLVGGNDALVFDGRSEAWSAQGDLIGRLKHFAEDLVVVDLADAGGPPPATDERDDEEDAREVADALVLGIRDYFAKTGFRQALIGLSGGMDSSLVAALATDALGAQNVHGLRMPSRYTSDASNDDAAELAEALGISISTLPIEGPHAAYLDALAPYLGQRDESVTDENLQARIRGNYLMALANERDALVLVTGNKSEFAVGYATLYGDMAGALAPIGDLVKTRVYEVAHTVNARAGRTIIPQRVFDKAPTAELRPDQTDQDTLPPYDVLDPIIEAWMERRLGPAEIAEEGIDRALVDEVLERIRRAEFKRWQVGPVLKVTAGCFTDGWRMPLAARWP